MKRLLILVTVITSSAFFVKAQKSLTDWMSISEVPVHKKSYVVPALWADFPRLNARTTLEILNAKGPGVITQIHASALGTDFGKGFNSPASQGVLIRVYYDGESVPSINMPLMDFLGDIQCQSDYFTSVYFSKVKESHNFRLPLPFRKCIKIELENPSDNNLVGYVDIQWDQVSHIPDNCGYLCTDYKNATLDPLTENILFQHSKPGIIVAHWLQYESGISQKGETICEADQRFFLDGDTLPTLNYLGTEDVYGYSWGFKGTHSDNWGAIIKQEDLQPDGSRIAVLRCRTNDAVSFSKSCTWILTYLNDKFHMNRLRGTVIPFRHCVYYYTKH